MAAECLIAAIDHKVQKRGEVVDIKPGGHEWGLKEQPPNYVHLTILNATRDQVCSYLEEWQIDFRFEILAENEQEWRIKVSVDPMYISASGGGRHMIGQVINWTTDSMTADIPKPNDLVLLKEQFSDVFKTVLDFRRYRFSDADVDKALSQAGKISMTKQQAQNRIIDKLTE
jgi:hypothetical protein